MLWQWKRKFVWATKTGGIPIQTLLERIGVANDALIGEVAKPLGGMWCYPAKWFHTMHPERVHWMLQHAPYLSDDEICAMLFAHVFDFEHRFHARQLRRDARTRPARRHPRAWKTLSADTTVGTRGTLMKRFTFCLLTFIVLTAGCFDGERGILTELIVNPAPNRENGAGYWPDAPLSDKVKAGTGSDMVVSPVPLEIQDALWGNWELLMDRLKAIMLLHKGGQHLDPETGELVWSTLSPVDGGLFGTLCELHVANRKFYDKYIDASGIAIIAPTDRTSNVGVRDEFLYVAREIILTMTSEMPELRQALSPEHGFYYVLVGARELEVNMPGELSLLNWYRGFYIRSSQGGVYRHLAVGGIESHIYLDPPQEAVSSEPVVHELAHAIDSTFDDNPHLFPDWDTRLKTAYTLAYQKALKGEGYFDDIRLHAMKNQEEYWAMGAGKWFTEMHGEGLPVDELQRTWLIERDPLLYALLDEVFPAVRLPTYIWIEE